VTKTLLEYRIHAKLSSPFQNPNQGGVNMSDKIFKLVELTGTSEKSLEDAIQNAVAKAAKTVRHLRWFEVLETRGSIDDDKVKQWQVTVKIGFALED
jgi:flavin-binding protein dodecin